MKRFIQTIIAALIITFGVCHGQTKGIGVVSIKDSSGRQIGLYKGSYALVFGVSDYTAGWPKLPSVVEETKLVQIALENAGFIVRRVLNPNEEILKREFEQFIDRYGYERDNRLLVFFSGHGYSRRKGAKGYLVPVDAPDPRKNEREFLGKALPMSQVIAWCRQIEAKHALFLFDSCFSGTIFKTKALPEIPPHISEITSRPVRQFITAGDAGEEVPAKSVFAHAFIRGLRGEGDLTKDGFITGTELGLFLHDKVLYYNTGQTPQYGKIRDPELDEGDFVFNISIQEPPKAIKQPIKSIKKVTTSVTWRQKDGKYWLYVDGESQNNTKSWWMDDDLLVYIPKLKRYCVLKGYKRKNDNTLREPMIPPTTSSVIWRQKDGKYWLYVDGESRSDTKSSWMDNDLLVYVPKLKRYYVLKDYKKKNDNTLREPMILPTTSSVTWRQKDGKYWVYVDGESQSDTKNSWMDNDLLVYIPKLKQYYVLKDYKKKNDNTLREATITSHK
ncbi:MAG: caspase family protein [Desulfobacterales bacterium]|jgi:hypothetical protein